VEGQGLRDRAPQFEEAGVEILGASFDRPEDNRVFAEKFDFPFRLLSDVDTTVGEAYEVKRAPEERDPHRPKRRTYLIDPEGVIRKAYRVWDVAAHPDEVLRDLAEMGVTPLSP
jgi:thioredoxin-dependent peroxiredoxin